MVIAQNRGGGIEKVGRRATGIRKEFGRTIRGRNEDKVAASKSNNSIRMQWMWTGLRG